MWEAFYEEIGAGFYQNRFWYLFGEGLEALAPCLDAWSFLVPPGTPRMILGRNAYGALLVLENPDEIGPSSRVRVLDPLGVVWWGSASIAFANLLGCYLPQKLLPYTFFDDSVYQAWQKSTGRWLEADEILAVRVPLALGGTMTLDNFQVENVHAYYRTTAPIYAKALAR